MTDQVPEQEGDPLMDAFYMAKGAKLSFLSDLGPMILAASHLDIANDSRSFARKFEQAHALVIREVSSLTDELKLLESDHKQEKSSKIRYQLTAAGQALFNDK